MVRLVTDYLDATVKKFPHKTALVDARRKIDFHALQMEAYHVAGALVQRKLFKRPILIFFGKSVESLTTFMGVVYSGNFIVPLDPKMPMRRIKKIKEIVQPGAVITDQEHEVAAKEIFAGIELLIYEDLQDSMVDVAAVRSQTARVIDMDLVYTLFTSGSTGIPKGVAISHRSVLESVDWMSDTFGLDETCVIGNGPPIYFALGHSDIFCTMKLGCTMYLIDPSVFVFPAQLMKFLIEKKINTITWVPAILSTLANSHILEELPELPVLRHVFFCGGTMPSRHIAVWRKMFPKTKFINLYGLTENTLFCAYYVVERDFADDELLPIGNSCRNKEVFLLNEGNELASENEIGELCVRGSVALGYYARPERTAGTFVQNPLQSFYPEVILRTGDFGRYNEYGEIVYVSRKDFQIKHMGQRIELGEIETVLSSVEGIATGCCLYDREKLEIIFFYTGTAEKREVMQFAKQSLPHYMVPRRLVLLESMPMTMNNKIDRVELKKLI